MKMTPAIEDAVMRVLAIVSPEGYEPEDLAQIQFAIANSTLAKEIPHLLADRENILQQDRLKTNEINILVKENRRLVEACKLVLLFHSASPWDDEKKQWWTDGLKAIGIPTNDATTKNLCDAVRVALGVQTP